MNGMKPRTFFFLLLAWPLPLQGATTPPVQVVWDFDGGISNEYGGHYNTYKRAPSWARTYLDAREARASRGHSLRITAHREAEGFCGVWMDFRPASEAPHQYFDAGSYRYLSFWAKGEKGGEDFEVSLTDAATANDDEHPSRKLRAYLPGGLPATWRPVVIPLSDFRGIDPRRLLRMTLNLTRKGDYRFYLDDIAFQREPIADPPAKNAEATVNSAINGGAPRAMWAWNTKPLLDAEKPQEADRFLAFCVAQKIGMVFLAAEFDRVTDAPGAALRLRNPEGYRTFLKRAHQKGLTVEALAGTPEWALRARHPEALVAVDSIIAFNGESGPDGRFEGVHFDVEPYSLLGYSDPFYRSEILLGLVEQAEKCRDRAHAAGLTFSCDLPSWFFAPGGLERDRLIVNFKGQEKTAGEHVADLVDSVTIMDYTNQADGAGGIIARALPALDYAAAHHRKVVVGVETFAESDSTVTFVLGLPAEEFWPRLAKSGLRGQYRLDDFRMSLCSDDLNMHIGLSTPREMAPEKQAVFEGALARLARQFGASSDPDRYHPSEMLSMARAALAEKPEWKGFEPYEFVDSDTGRHVQCFRSTHRMLPSITFHGLGRETFDEEMASTVEWLGRHPGFGGTAVHFYESFRELVEGDEPPSGVRSQKASASVN